MVKLSKNIARTAQDMVRAIPELILVVVVGRGGGGGTFRQTNERVEVREGASHVDNMVKLAKNISRTAQDMVRAIPELIVGWGWGAEEALLYLVIKDNFL